MSNPPEFTAIFSATYNVPGTPATAYLEEVHYFHNMLFEISKFTALLNDETFSRRWIIRMELSKRRIVDSAYVIHQSTCDSFRWYIINGHGDRKTIEYVSEGTKITALELKKALYRMKQLVLESAE